MVGDLGLDITRTTGRAAHPLQVEVCREISEADLELLLRADRGSTAAPIAKIRDSHHALAKCLASGMKDSEASAMTGYSPSRISILKADPTFQELLAGYRKLADQDFQTFHERLVTLGTGAVAELQERFEEAPETFTKAELMNLGFEIADRIGHGKKTTNVNVNVDVAARLEAARRRSGLAPTPPAALPPSSSVVLDGGTQYSIEESIP